jgi:transposase
MYRLRHTRLKLYKLLNKLTMPVVEVRRFAVGLRQEYAAVAAALEHPWSNGPVEGHGNRLKTIKRQMYGRANFDLLKALVSHAA